MFWLFSQYDVINSQNVNKPSGVQYQMLLQFAHLLIFLKTEMGLIIIKDRRRAATRKRCIRPLTFYDLAF